MEGPLNSGGDEGERPSPPPPKSAHLMCATRFWGVAGAVGCGYFAYLAYSSLREADYSVSHDSWELLTYSVWIVLALGLISEVRCRRERIFFGLVLLNLTLGFVLTAWPSVPATEVRAARRIESAIWILAAFASLWTAKRVPPLTTKN